jgi:aspartate racemase
MERGFYQDRLETTHGLSVLVPDEPGRDVAHRVICDELVQRVIRDESRKRYLEIISRLADRGAQGVIAGCTEIELPVTGDDTGLPWLPTTRLHTEAIAELALTDSKGQPPPSAEPRRERSSSPCEPPAPCDRSLTRSVPTQRTEQSVRHALCDRAA